MAKLNFQHHYSRL